MGAENCASGTELISKYRINDKDTGSPEVQIALVTKRLDNLAEHFKGHAQDVQSQRGMQVLISRRKKLLQYLKKENITRYKNLISSLGIRK